MDVWNHTTASDRGLDEGVELLVASDCELQMSWSNSLHLKIFGSVTSELEDLSGQVLEDGGAVDGGGGSDSAVGTHSALEDSMDSADWELNSKIKLGARDL